jgi:hypothetical protein
MKDIILSKESRDKETSYPDHTYHAMKTKIG